MTHAPLSAGVVVPEVPPPALKAMSVETDERVVRVTAQSLTRLMGFGPANPSSRPAGYNPSPARCFGSSDSRGALPTT